MKIKESCESDSWIKELERKMRFREEKYSHDGRGAGFGT